MSQPDHRERGGESAHERCIGVSALILITDPASDGEPGDERLTAALLDRLTHHAHIIELLDESYRFRQRAHGEHAE